MWGRSPAPPLCAETGAALAIPAAVENSMGTCPRRHWLTLRRRKPSGGLNPGGAGSAGVSDAQRWVQGDGRLPTLLLASFLPPIPPTPFPGGEGGDFFHYFAGGFAPGTPALNRLQHL